MQVGVIDWQETIYIFLPGNGKKIDCIAGFHFLTIFVYQIPFVRESDFMMGGKNGTKLIPRWEFNFIDSFSCCENRIHWAFVVIYREGIN